MPTFQEFVETKPAKDEQVSNVEHYTVMLCDALYMDKKSKTLSYHYQAIASGGDDNAWHNSKIACFDLDRNTGLYQNSYDQIGIGFGPGGLYMSRIDNGNNSSSLYITAVDQTSTNTDIVLSPKGTGSVKVTGNFVVSDQTFILEDAQGPRVRFEAGQVGTGTSTRIMTFPAITTGSGTTLVGSDTQQTLTNKTILIDEDNLVIVDGQEEAIFQINWSITSDTRRSYFLPDAGAVTTTNEPTATSSTLLDTKAEQIALNKTLVAPKFAANAEVDTPWVIFNTDSLTDNRTITVPDLSLTLVGLDTTQTLTNKTIEELIISDSADITKRITLSTENQNTQSNRVFEFPLTPRLNTTVDQKNTLVTVLAEQTLSNKTIVQPAITEEVGGFTITLRADNITEDRVIRFPDSDATLLSTENVTAEDVNFGAGIGGQTLTGRTRQQQFFYAGF